MADLEQDASDVERGPIGNDPQRWVARTAPEPQHRQEDGDADDSDAAEADSDSAPS
jgi:hypothetical protein